MRRKLLGGRRRLRRVGMREVGQVLRSLLLLLLLLLARREEVEEEEEERVWKLCSNWGEDGGAEPRKRKGTPRRGKDSEKEAREGR